MGTQITIAGQIFELGFEKPDNLPIIHSPFVEIPPLGFVGFIASGIVTVFDQFANPLRVVVVNPETVGYTIQGFEDPEVRARYWLAKIVLLTTGLVIPNMEAVSVVDTIPVDVRMNDPLFDGHQVVVTSERKFYITKTEWQRYMARAY